MSRICKRIIVFITAFVLIISSEHGFNVNMVKATSKNVNKVYNNGKSTVEWNGKLYFYHSQKPAGIYSYDIKKKKKTKVISESGNVSNIWIANDCLIYIKYNTKQNNCHIQTVSLKTKKSKKIYTSDNSLEIIGVDISSKIIYIAETNAVKALKMDGTVWKEEGIAGEGSISGMIIGKNLLLQNGANVYYGTMEKGIKKLATVKTGDDWIDENTYIDFLGEYGDYVYGCVYGPWGSSLDLMGYVFQIAVKTGKVSVYKEKSYCFLNHVKLTSKYIYVSNWQSNKEKTICYQLDKKKGKIKRKVYSCGLGTANGQNIYYENNEEGKKKIVCFNTKKGKGKILDSRYKKKNKFYYGSSLKIINGKLFFIGEDCSSGKTVGWRMVPDKYHYYYINLKNGKAVKYDLIKAN